MVSNIFKMMTTSNLVSQILDSREYLLPLRISNSDYLKLNSLFTSFASPNSVREIHQQLSWSRIHVWFPLPFLIPYIQCHTNFYQIQLLQVLKSLPSCANLISIPFHWNILRVSCFCIFSISPHYFPAHIFTPLLPEEFSLKHKFDIIIFYQKYFNDSPYFSA